MRKTRDCLQSYFPNFRKSRAQAAVEFALILPIALLMIFTIIEIARMAQAWLVVTNSARVGLRYAVTGAYESSFCTLDIDANNNDLVCEHEPEKAYRNDEIDTARLLSIYEEVEESAIGIMKDLSIIEKSQPGYFNITVCSTNKEPEPDGETRVYHPPPDDYCSPFDHPGDPSTGTARVLVAVTFEHPVILPILNRIAPSVTLHSERTGIVEQFRVARILGLPPVIKVPTVTPLSLTSTITPTNTIQPTPVDCSLYTMSDFWLGVGNQAGVNINNLNPSSDVSIVDFNVNWDSPYAWANALGYDNLHVAWFKLNGDVFYNGKDYLPPTHLQAQDQILPAGTSLPWEINFDFTGETNGDRAFIKTFGLSADNIGFSVTLNNGCVIQKPENYLPPPQPNCEAYSIGDINIISNGNIQLDITNGDKYGTQIDSIELNWDYAEEFEQKLIGSNELNVDYFQYGGLVTWGEGDGGSQGAGRDYDSTTHTSIDSPSSFPGDWSSSGLPEFDEGQTYQFIVDFDGKWGSFASDLVASDFGIAFNFTNGCKLIRPAKDRALPAPTLSCENLFVDGVGIFNNEFEIGIVNQNNAPASLIQSYLEWPGPITPPSNTRKEPYVDYLELGGQRYFKTNTYNSPLIVSVGSSNSKLPSDIPGEDFSTWLANFKNGMLFGEYCAELTFEYIGWGICVIEECIELVDSTGTPTQDQSERVTPTEVKPTTITPANTETPIPTLTNTQKPTNTPSSKMPTRTPTVIEEAPTKTPRPTLPGGG